MGARILYRGGPRVSAGKFIVESRVAVVIGDYELIFSTHRHVPGWIGTRGAVDGGLAGDCIAIERKLVFRVRHVARGRIAHGSVDRDRAQRGLGLQIESL